jgi:hypothetical protein
LGIDGAFALFFWAVVFEGLGLSLSQTINVASILNLSGFYSPPLGAKE